MLTIRLLLLVALMPMLAFSQSSFTKKYAGAYNIMPESSGGAEAYTLREDGTAVWIYGFMSGGKLQTQQKTGTWTAKEGSIRISIKGNTGVIVEEYIFKSGKFVNKENPNRYLRKRP